MINRLLTLFTLLIAVSLGTPDAWAVQRDIPVINASFELTYPPGTDSLDYWWGGEPPEIMCPVDSNAKDGSRVLRLDTGVSGGYRYAFGPMQEQYGIDEIIQPNWSYTVSAWAKKAADHTNAGGWLFVDVGPDKGTFGTYRVRIEIPQLTEDEVWKQYSIVLDTVANPEYVGNYMSLIALGGYYGDENTWMVFDHVTIVGEGPPTSIAGTVTLTDWTPADPDNVLTPVKIELVPQGSGVAKTEVVVLDENNAYSIECEPGTYAAAFSAAKGLKKLVTGIEAIQASQTECSVVLVNGDANGDSQIDTSDFDIVSGNFDQGGD